MDGFPSGQRGQTVNLLQIASVVRIHLHPFGTFFIPICRSGGTGRRPGLKIPWVVIPVPVRFRSAALVKSRRNVDVTAFLLFFISFHIKHPLPINSFFQLTNDKYIKTKNITGG